MSKRRRLFSSPEKISQEQLPSCEPISSSLVPSKDLQEEDENNYNEMNITQKQQFKNKSTHEQVSQNDRHSNWLEKNKKVLIPANNYQTKEAQNQEILHHKVDNDEYQRQSFHKQLINDQLNNEQRPTFENKSKDILLQQEHNDLGLQSQIISKEQSQPNQQQVESKVREGEQKQNDTKIINSQQKQHQQQEYSYSQRVIPSHEQQLTLTSQHNRNTVRVESQQQIQLLEEDLIQMQDRLRQEQLTFLGLEDKYHQLQQYSKAQMKQIEELQVQIDSTQSYAQNNKIIKDKNSLLKEEINKLNVQNKQLSEDNKQLLDKNSLLVDKNKNIKQENNSFKDDNLKLKEENHNLTEQNKQLLQDKQESIDENKNLNDIKNNLIDQNTQLMQQNEEMKQSINNLSLEKNQLKEQNHLVYEQNNLFKQRGSQLNTEIQQLKGTNLSINEQNKSLVNQYHILTQDHITLQFSYQKLLLQINDIQQNLKETEQKLEDNTNKLIENQQKEKENQQPNKENEQKIKETELKDSEQRVNELLSELQEYMKQMNEFKQQYVQLELQNEQQQQQNEELISKNSQLSSQITQAQMNNSHPSTQYNQMIEQISEMESAFKQLQSDLDQTKQQRQIIQSQLINSNNIKEDQLQLEANCEGDDQSKKLTNKATSRDNLINSRHSSHSRSIKLSSRIQQDNNHKINEEEQTQQMILEQSQQQQQHGDEEDDCEMCILEKENHFLKTQLLLKEQEIIELKSDLQFYKSKQFQYNNGEYGIKSLLQTNDRIYMNRFEQQQPIQQLAQSLISYSSPQAHSPQKQRESSPLQQQQQQQQQQEEQLNFGNQNYILPTPFIINQQSHHQIISMSSTKNSISPARKNQFTPKQRQYIYEHEDIHNQQKQQSSNQQSIFSKDSPNSILMQKEVELLKQLFMIKCKELEQWKKVSEFH